jgi:hypothetical protein
VKGVDVLPLRFSKRPVGGFEEVHPHLLTAIEVQEPAVGISDAVVVKVRFVFDLDRAVIQDFTVRTNRCSMLEFGLKPGLFCSCHLDFPPFGFPKRRKSLWPPVLFFMVTSPDLSVSRR